MCLAVKAGWAVSHFNDNIYMMKATKYGVCLLLLYALFYLFPLQTRALWQPDESRYAEISREMLVTHHWADPHFLGLRYFEKPVMGYWVNNVSQMIFGHNNFAVRFGSVFSVSLCALLAGWLAWLMWRDKKLALISGGIYLTCLLVNGIGTYAVLDPMIALCLTASMVSFWRAATATTTGGRAAWYLVLGVTCGLGVMTKGFLALAVPVISIIPWVMTTRRWREVLIFGPLAVLSCLLITLPWALTINAREPDFWHYFFWIEHIQRFAEPDAQHKAPVWYYLPVLLGGCLPWLGYLPAALKNGWQGRHTHPGTIYLLGWVIMPLIFFSIAKGKLPTYILPCFAPLAILLGKALLNASRRTINANGWINLIFGATGILLLVVSWHMPSHPFYRPQEGTRFLLALAIFLSWALFGGLSLLRHGKLRLAAALCPLGLALLVGYVIPTSIRDSKQPQHFLDQMTPHLTTSRYILSNRVGIASGIAWHLKRSDIDLYDEKGELTYGLSYADAKGRFITREAFPAWLADHRNQGVSMVLQTNKGESLSGMQLPVPDFSYQQGRLLYVEYGAQK